jgi:hypothetical protein
MMAGGGIHFDQGRRLVQERTFQDHLPRNQDGSLILTDLVYQNGRER